MPARAIIEDEDEWTHLQKWFKEVEDPLRPWNVSAIARKLKLAQPMVRALLTKPKDADGVIRTAFTRRRLRLFQKLFGDTYSFVPLKPITKARKKEAAESVAEQPDGG